MSRATAALALAVLSASPLLAGSPATPRQEALAALADQGDADARRRGARGLGDVGTMADVPVLVRALRDQDPFVRALAENAMWRLWSRSGDDEVDRLLERGVEQMSARELPAAVETFTRVIERRPEFAEGWNKRATVYYLLGEYRKSLADCGEVIRRNPYHFGALSGFAMNYVQLDQLAQALDYFEQALGVNPNLAQVQEAVEAIRAILAERRKDAI